mgnify:CR=1 FL=1
MREIPNEREEEARDGIITFHFESLDSELYGFQLRHSALYLGNERFFGQIDLGKEFKAMTIAEYIQTLRKNERPSLKLEFYSIRN